MTSESEKNFLSHAIETETVLSVVFSSAYSTLVSEREIGVRHPYCTTERKGGEYEVHGIYPFLAEQLKDPVDRRL